MKERSLAAHPAGMGTPVAELYVLAESAVKAPLSSAEILSVV
jgi:hypothetical protein